MITPLTQVEYMPHDEFLQEILSSVCHKNTIGVAESMGHCRYKLSHMYTASVEYLQPPERSQCAVDRHDEVYVTIANTGSGNSRATSISSGLVIRFIPLSDPHMARPFL